MNIEGIRKHGYASMPPMEDALVSYLSMGYTLMLKTLALSTKPLRVTLQLNGRAYVAAGQAGGALHTMATLPG